MKNKMFRKKEKVIIKRFVTIFFIVFALPLAKANSTDQASNLKIITKTLKTPDGWSKQASGVLESVQSPKKDLTIYFHKEAISPDFDFSKKSVDLWKQVDLSFSYEEKKKTSLSNSKGWDKLTQIIYSTPLKEFKIIISIAREKDGVAYINLITGSMAAISKRAAQMNIIIQKWKPESIKDKDYSSVKAKPFKGIVKHKFNRFVRKLKRELNIPGIAIGIIQDSRIVYKKGFGRTKTVGGQPVNSDTLFMIGSMTKPLTTLMMAKLVHENKLSWDDPIKKLLINWSLKDKKATKNILIKHSACACTGMPRRDFDFIFEIDGISAEDRMKQMKEMSPTTKLGETFQYSNYLVAAGGFAAAKSYEQTLPLLDSYKKAMRDLVFNPLSMKRTVVINKSPYIKNSAFPYSYDLSLKPELISTKIEEFTHSVAPAGSIWSNVDDILRYLSLELNDTQLFPDYINTPILLSRRKSNIKITDKMNYGLGLLVENHRGLEIFQHGGNTMGFSSDMFFIPKKNIGVVILTNTGGASILPIREKLMELLFGMEPDTGTSLFLIKSELKRTFEGIKNNIKPSIHEIKTLEGMYRSKNLGNLNIYTKKGKLYADFDEFITQLVEIKTPGQNRAFLPITPPWNWTGGFQMIRDGNNFILPAAQEKYIFEKVSENK